MSASLPQVFVNWFESRGWEPRPHQLALANIAGSGESALLIAPTGAGKTLAGFLPTLIDLHQNPDQNRRSIHTLYISPLKALAVDIARNLEMPVEEMGLKVRIETRTGDTPQHKRQRQKLTPPDIMLTTPEQLALLIASKEAELLFSGIQKIVLDELHALVSSKRGELLSLGLARVRRFQPDVQMIGLSATVALPDELRAWLKPQIQGEADNLAELITVEGGARPNITVLDSAERIPWSGHSARYAFSHMYESIRNHQMVLIFVNTRSQAEMIFKELWLLNEDALPIALHHGSLDAGQRRKVEAAMSASKLRAVVCTSTLDLGIDWGDVDLVINVGAPKGASRLAQRIGRANHRMGEPSKALLVPANIFEVLECRAALDAAYEGAQDTPPVRIGGLDVLAQHVLGSACGAPFHEVELFEEICSAFPYRDLDWETFEQVVDFVATGGYALRVYERYARIRKTEDGTWRLTHPRLAQQYRLNIGTIVQEPMIKIRVTSRKKSGRLGRGGRVLGEVEEYFIDGLAPRDTFLFGGEVLRFEMLQENEALVTRTEQKNPRIPAYAGGKFPLSTYLAERVRGLLIDHQQWHLLPAQVQDWLELQRGLSQMPGRDDLLIETFPHEDQNYMVLYPFEGRLAHQTLGMLLTRRLERMRARPMGFVATEYALAVWGLGDMGRDIAAGTLSLAGLFDEDMLGDDLESWLAESSLLKRTFRNCAVISGLIERRFPGKEKTGRQMTISSDLIYDVLREHDPDHVLLRATWADASDGLLDLKRLSTMLERVKGKLVHKKLQRISPLAVPVMLEIGREPVYGEAQDVLLAQAADDMMRDLAKGKRNES